MRRIVAGGALVGALLLLGVIWGWQVAHRRTLVVYCAHDASDAEKILRDFEKRSGIPVSIRFGNGDPKSPSLAALLIQEKEAPQCDVFWNNEPLGTLDLQERGLLQPYQGAGYARIPVSFKAPDGSWTGFAARLRVVLYSTAKIGTTPPNLTALLPGSDLSRIAIANPLSGTTLTHYTLLWHSWGAARVRTWHRDWRSGGVKELENNAAVRQAVAAGVCYAGFGDTDDFFKAKHDGQPVAMLPVRLEDGRTICVPNTIAILRSSRYAHAARQLADFLLSEEIELTLANSQVPQIPLGAVPANQLPTEVRQLLPAAQEGADLTTLGSARAECLAWLKSEYLQ